MDIRDLDLQWFRSQLGVVSQEPVLFAGTVIENIAFGCPNATIEQIEVAAKMADAHNFILTLPEVGFMLSWVLLENIEPFYLSKVRDQSLSWFPNCSSSWVSYAKHP